jgi:hypothetical protein
MRRLSSVHYTFVARTAASTAFADARRQTVADNCTRVSLAKRACAVDRARRGKRCTRRVDRMSRAGLTAPGAAKCANVSLVPHACRVVAGPSGRGVRPRPLTQLEKAAPVIDALLSTTGAARFLLALR